MHMQRSTYSTILHTYMRLTYCAYLRRRSPSWEDMQRSELVEFQCYLFVAHMPGELRLPTTKKQARLTLSALIKSAI